MTGAEDGGMTLLCKSCGTPFSPSHDVNASGPTVRHPYFPVALGRAAAATHMSERRLREWLREWLRGAHDGPSGFMDDIRAALAELDRQRSIVQAAEALVAIGLDIDHDMEPCTCSGDHHDGTGCRVGFHDPDACPQCRLDALAARVREAAMPDRAWDIGDPEPDGVIAVQDYTYDPHDCEVNAHWGRTTSSEWKGYKDGNKVYLGWAELVRRWGPVTTGHEDEGREE